MARRFCFLLVFLLAVPLAAKADIVLRPIATVQGDTVHLGDLFEGVGERASMPVAVSPPPGSKTVYDANWLAALAQAQGLTWQPQSPYDQVTVERASQPIGSDQIARRLIDAIGEHDPVGDAELQFDNPGLRLVVGSDQATTIAVDGLSFDRRSGRFSAFVFAPAEDANAPRLHVSGRLITRLQVPVPTRTIAPGETITERDLHTVAIDTDHMNQDFVTGTADLIGKAPRRSLRAEEPVRSGDIELPIVVHRGALVTITLDTPTMQLTAQGKAVDDGNMGAVIRVTNTQSNRVIDAVVAGPNTVTVSTTPSLVMQ